MEAALAALEASAVAESLRSGRWAYAVVNAAHILGIGLLIGAIVPLDLRRLGLWPSVDRGALGRVLLPVALAGLALALACGLALFSVRAGEYAANPAFRVKIALIAAGLVNAGVFHLRGGESRGQAALSLAIWPVALLSGRLIAFVE